MEIQVKMELLGLLVSQVSPEPLEVLDNQDQQGLWASLALMGSKARADQQGPSVPPVFRAPTDSLVLMER
jgi:hypothetical protein